MENKMLKSRNKASEVSKVHSPFRMKEYTSEAGNIPLEKNWLESWCTLPEAFDTVLEEILNYEVRSDDVFVVTFIKCGTTWMQEAAYLMLNNLDFEECEIKSVLERSPFIDIHGIVRRAPNMVKFSQLLPSPRLIKTHMPANLLPRQVWERKQKIIYVARNCKDVIVSSYHFTKNLGLWCGENLEDYVKDFLSNEIIYTSFWNHILDFWKMRNEPFIFFVTYEEMTRDLAGVLQRMSEFLGQAQLTPEQMKKILEHLSFDKMKANKQTNPTFTLRRQMPNIKENFQFMRRGIVGSYKDELTPELQSKIDNWSRKCLAQHGLIEEDIFGKL